MSDVDDVKPLLVEIRDIVLRHEEVDQKDSDFRKRVLFALLFALALAVLAMGYGLLRSLHDQNPTTTGTTAAAKSCRSDIDESEALV